MGRGWGEAEKNMKGKVRSGGSHGDGEMINKHRWKREEKMEEE